jgi:hypothetical protein
MWTRLKDNLIDFFLMVIVLTALYSGLKYIYTAGYEDGVEDFIEYLEHEQEEDKGNNLIY